MGSRFCEWDRIETKAAMSTQTGAQGGYLVPTEFYNRLMMLATERSIVRQRATIVPMSARSVKVPVLDMTTAPAAGDSAFLGGLVGRWTEEGTALNESEPAFKEVELINYELSGYSKISNTLLADGAIGLEAFLMQLFARAIAWYEDYAFLRGNGVGKPLGALTWAGLISVARSAAINTSVRNHQERPIDRLLDLGPSTRMDASKFVHFSLGFDFLGNLALLLLVVFGRKLPFC